MENDTYDEDHNDTLEYRDPNEIAPYELSEALGSLSLMDDPYLRMQVTNLSVVDQFLMPLEYQVLASLHQEERTPAETTFLNANSQMWIFGAYELLRTWRERAQDVLKLHKNGGLKLKIEALRKDIGFRHVGRELQADQLQQVLDDSKIIAKIEEDIRLIHIPFARIEHLRVALAKHQVRGKSKKIAYAPGYGRINSWCGSLDYQLENNGVILGNISRRDIADELRALSNRTTLPSDDDLKSFDSFMEAARNPPDFSDN